MSIEVSKDGVILVKLLGEPETRKKLDIVLRHVRDGNDRDVIMDFSDVTILTSRSLSPLLRLHDFLDSRGRRLVLYNMDQATLGVLSVTALDMVFHTANSEPDALALVHASILEV